MLYSTEKKMKIRQKIFVLLLIKCRYFFGTPGICICAHPNEPRQSNQARVGGQTHDLTNQQSLRVKNRDIFLQLHIKQYFLLFAFYFSLQFSQTTFSLQYQKRFLSLLSCSQEFMQKDYLALV